MNLNKPRTKRPAAPPKSHEEAKSQAVERCANWHYQACKCIALSKDERAPPHLRKAARIELDAIAPKLESAHALLVALGLMDAETPATEKEEITP